jgi:FixJ family two-component response regulator
MPEMGGPELARRLAGERPGLPVLYMTGYSDGQSPVSRERILAKPFSPAALEQAVRAALEAVGPQRRSENRPSA